MKEHYVRMDRTHILNMLRLTNYTAKDMQEDKGGDGESSK